MYPGFSLSLLLRLQGVILILFETIFQSDWIVSRSTKQPSSFKKNVRFLPFLLEQWSDHLIFRNSSSLQYVSLHCLLMKFEAFTWIVLSSRGFQLSSIQCFYVNTTCFIFWNCASLTLCTGQPGKISHFRLVCWYWNFWFWLDLLSVWFILECKTMFDRIPMMTWNLPGCKSAMPPSQLDTLFWPLILQTMCNWTHRE